MNVAFGLPPRPADDFFDVTLSRLSLPGLGSSASVVNKLLNLGETNSPLKIAGMKVQPGLALELSPDNGGQLKATFRVGLPEVAFKKLPGSPEGVTVEFSPTFSNDRGVTFGGRIKLGTVYMFGKKVKDLDLAYDHGTGLFDGSLGVVLGPERLGIEPVLTGSITIGPPLPGPDCGFRKLGLIASNLQRLVGPGVFLQRVGGTFECITAGGNLSVKLTAVGGVSLGPRISIGGFETEAVSIDGTNVLTVPVTQSAPFTLEASGVGKVVDFPVSSQTVTYTSPATIRLAGTLDMTIGGYGAQLGYGEGTFVSPTAFNIEAAGNANVFGFQFGARGGLLEHRLRGLHRRGRRPVRLRKAVGRRADRVRRLRRRALPDRGAGRRRAVGAAHLHGRGRAAADRRRRPGPRRSAEGRRLRSRRCALRDAGGNRRPLEQERPARAGPAAGHDVRGPPQAGRGTLVGRRSRASGA